MKINISKKINRAAYENLLSECRSATREHYWDICMPRLDKQQEKINELEEKIKTLELSLDLIKDLVRINK